MKKRTFDIVIFILLIVTLPTFTFGCSQAFAKVSRFPKDIYVFTGKVIGYTDGFDSKEIQSKAFGLKIEAIDILNAPRKTSGFYEVFPFGVEADCSPIAYDLEELKRTFTVGSEVRVMADEARLLPNLNQSSQIRLEAQRLLTVEKNDLENNYTFSTDSFFNYKNSEYQRMVILQFELYKDLLRIENAKSDSSKVKVLERLVYFQGYWLDFESLLKRHINSKIASKLLNKRKSFIKIKFKS